MDGYKVIDPKNKIIFVHIPKTGGSSINASLLSLRGIDHKGSFFGPKLKASFMAGHQTALEMKEEILTRGEDWNSYWKFSIVRNPYDRIDSSYNWHHTLGHSTPEIPFLETVNYAKYEDYLFDNEKQLMVDKVYKFEQGMDYIYREIEKQIGFILPRRKAKMVEKIKKYRFTTEAKNIILKKSNFDFEYFNYDKEKLP